MLEYIGNEIHQHNTFRDLVDLSVVILLTGGHLQTYCKIKSKVSTGVPLDMRILVLGKTRISRKSHIKNQKVVA